MHQIEGIVFEQHHLGPGNYQARVLCYDGTTLSIIQCDGTGELCKRFEMPTVFPDRGCFYGTTSDEAPFEVMDYSENGPYDDVHGYQTALDICQRIIQHGGLMENLGSSKE